MTTMAKPKQWIAAVVSAVGLSVPLGLLCHSGDAGLAPVAALFSGWVFTERPIITGGALDQPSLQKELFLLCFSLVVLCPPLAFVRWINGGSSRSLRRLFAIASLVILLHPLSILTIFAYDVFRYVYHMGVTPLRLMGLAGAMAGYVTLAVFSAWLCRIKIAGCRQPVQTYHNG